MMKLTINRFSNITITSLLTVIMQMSVTTVSAQHGIAIDFGKNHKEDTTHVTNFSLGVASNTDTLKGVQLNAAVNFVPKKFYRGWGGSIGLEANSFFFRNYIVVVHCE